MQTLMGIQRGYFTGVHWVHYSEHNYFVYQEFTYHQQSISTVPHVAADEDTVIQGMGAVVEQALCSILSTIFTNH